MRTQITACRKRRTCVEEISAEYLIEMKTEYGKDAVYDVGSCQNRSGFNILLDRLPQAQVQEPINTTALVILVGWRDLLVWYLRKAICSAEKNMTVGESICIRVTPPHKDMALTRSMRRESESTEDEERAFRLVWARANGRREKTDYKMNTVKKKKGGKNIKLPAGKPSEVYCLQ